MRVPHDQPGTRHFNRPGVCQSGQGVGVHGRQPESADDDPEFTNTPRREFNLWFDPEAAHIVLRAPWKKIVCTPVDILREDKNDQ